MALISYLRWGGALWFLLTVVRAVVPGAVLLDLLCAERYTVVVEGEHRWIKALFDTDVAERLLQHAVH